MNENKEKEMKKNNNEKLEFLKIFVVIFFILDLYSFFALLVINNASYKPIIYLYLPPRKRFLIIYGQRQKHLIHIHE